ncbi:hypothetical protein PCANC_16695 [Puccinia coronata f. sp. avenae]|uniref:Uncharacterized protein n=1 Tax=Puccinia coronata f. sp. avenae TaxID=200324 RepID=A0A2N5SJ94_9BASI|nr:hypothetical protein PCANC_16695 [Puccinia coronata f. sp. avenae]
MDIALRGLYAEARSGGFNPRFRGHSCNSARVHVAFISSILTTARTAKKTHPVGLSGTASDTIVQCYVGQACPTGLSDMGLDNSVPGSMGLSDMGSDDCAQSRVKQAGSMSLSNMGSNNLCLMSFYSSDRLFDCFESVAEQASDLLGKLFSQQGIDLLVKELGEQANNLLAKS